jgi:hypothetical protein
MVLIRKDYDSVRQKGKLLKALREASPCKDCGCFYPAGVMEYDHVRGQKFKEISVMRNYSWARILEEIKKCDLVCANCHRLRHINKK